MDLDVIVAASRATNEFKAQVDALARHEHTPLIVTVRRAPIVKVQRVLAQLMAEHPELSISAVRIDARSGCSDYVGSLDVESEDGVRRFTFAWCCRWRAEEEGWTDVFGFPDQIRAADEFTWRCFREWREVASVSQPDYQSLTVARDIV